MKKTLILVFFAMLVALTIHQQMKIAALEKALAKSPVGKQNCQPMFVPEVKRDCEAERQSNDVTVSASAVEEVVPSVKPVEHSEEVVDKTKPDMTGFMKGIASMMTNSSMKAMIKRQALAGLEMRYARLFKFLNRTPEDIATLKKLLMDRQMMVMEAGMSFLGGKATTEVRLKQAEALQQTKDAYDKQIADLLGPEDYDAFKQYENTQSERTYVESFKNTLSASEDALTEQQECDLVNAMYSARTNLPGLSALVKNDAPPDPSQFTGAGITNLLSSMDNMWKMYELAAGTILTPKQKEQYKEFIDQQREMSTMGMKFAAEMFAGESNAVPSRIQGPGGMSQ